MPSYHVIPSIEQLRQRAAVRAMEERFGSSATLEALRDAAARLRTAIAESSSSPPDSRDRASAIIEQAAESDLIARSRGSLRSVVNATGVIIHTNLGRAPLAATARQRLSELAAGYTNLEYDLVNGVRGSRNVHAEPLLKRLTSAEAAVVVNNNAAATLLMLSGLASGREVLISRGELVEIGGGFRVPDVMRQSGAILREVGTTNRTRVTDYTASCSERTAMILRVHPSNFRIEGFTERPSLEGLVQAGRAMGVPVVEDLGSGCLVDGLPNEPSVRTSIDAGVDLVCFSGDKLLGGPQAGIVAGQATLIDRLRKHPLMRALRVDKLTLAALEATLAEYVAGRANQTIPVHRMLHASAETIEGRARVLAERLHGHSWRVALVSGSSAVGGGSAPGVTVPTVLLAIEREGLSPDALESALRSLDPPVIARIESDRVVLDLRTVFETQDERLGDLLISAFPPRQP
ncbi:MAG: L-seryl-tRNA(Sec) selenium transferase [Vicinamibacterales bacterium]